MITSFNFFLTSRNDRELVHCFALIQGDQSCLFATKCNTLIVNKQLKRTVPGK